MGRMKYEMDGKEGRSEKLRCKEAEVRKSDIYILCFEKKNKKTKL